MENCGPFDNVGSWHGVGGNSHAYLTEEQRTALFSHCSPDLQALLRALLFTAARPGEFAGCIVADFDRPHGTLLIRESKTGERVATLSTAAIEFFKTQLQDRIGSAPLMLRAKRCCVQKDAWKKTLRAAAAAAERPSDVVLYSLRDAAIQN